MPVHLSLAEMSARLRSRTLSPVELVDAHLARIERANPSLNAFVCVLADEARAAAREAAQRIASEGPRGPLDGIPFTIKDSFDVAGLPTTCGSRFHAGTRAAHDSTVMRRMRDAGAILLGKTNTPEFLASYETDNYITGRTNNPWDLERTPGGSSGGEASAIAAFLSPGGIGSDGGGSIRMPAHFTGIAGLKPTPGRISTTGHVPAMTNPAGMLGVAGPMARTAADVRLLFQTLAGYDPADPFSVPVGPREPQLDGLRIGLMEQFGQVPVQPDIRNVVQRAAACLGDLGFEVEPFAVTGLERTPNLWSFLFSELPARGTRDFIAGREQDAHWTSTEFLYRALEKPEPTSRRILEVLASRDRMRAELLARMDRTPVVLTPACGITAFRHRERRWPTGVKDIGLFEAVIPLTPFNLLGLPGMVIPFGLAGDGLPIGVQLVARPFEDEMLLELAVRLEQVRGPFPGPKGY